MDQLVLQSQSDIFTESFRQVDSDDGLVGAGIHPAPAMFLTHPKHTLFLLRVCVCMHLLVSSLI